MANIECKSNVQPKLFYPEAKQFSEFSFNMKNKVKQQKNNKKNVYVFFFKLQKKIVKFNPPVMNAPGKYLRLVKKRLAEADQEALAPPSRVTNVMRL